MNGIDSSFAAVPQSHLVAGMPPAAVLPPVIENRDPIPEELILEEDREVLQEGPNFERFRAIAITTAVTHVLATAPASTLYQRASISGRNLFRPTSISSALRTHADEFRQFHRQESFPFVLGSGLLDLCDGAVSGALLGVLVELSKVGWVVMTLGDEVTFEETNNNQQQQPVPTLAQRVKHLLYFGVSNAACFAAAAALCLPLHIANFQVRHHIWRGWRPGVFPLAQYYKALPTLSVEYQFMQIFNRRLRRHVYDLLGRPFSVPLATVRRLEREEKAARRLIRGKEKLVDDDDDEDDEDEGEDGVGEKKGKALQRRGKGKIGGKKNGNRKGKCSRVAGGAGCEEGEDDDEALDLADMGRELARQVGFHALTRGIAVGVTLLTSVVHMPLCTITNSILASPSSYTGPIDCAQKILAAEGWQGFYKGLFWYVLYTSDVLFLHDVWTGAELSLAD
ncbi:uncharacterized protein ACA1_060940 [Acanthamoeba castellanii str. Neff]|uniref:Carrier superfamily protein n=1 Tax=Acanthamoeba castellanii (strain ATCC 30010 / Neff) TaxID=1257118 RepID=L8GZ18_ACACF|nr:uncharacterized protein ACA1_060940 [Acanthamoeba castellanii str. Neff]ELR17356.1 hypothetical protein ACA1_060940 [Acanthamoeba castellanii str. Neff]